MQCKKGNFNWFLLADLLFKRNFQPNVFSNIESFKIKRSFWQFASVSNVYWTGTWLANSSRSLFARTRSVFPEVMLKRNRSQYCVELWGEESTSDFRNELRLICLVRIQIHYMQNKHEKEKHCSVLILYTIYSIILNTFRAAYNFFEKRKHLEFTIIYFFT